MFGKLHVKSYISDYMFDPSLNLPKKYAEVAEVGKLEPI